MATILFVSFVLAFTTRQDDAAGAREVLDALARKQADLKTLRGSFVQSIRTPLAKEPIVSEGTMAFRREPPCAVFVLTSPRRSIIRFDEKSYRVYRPAEEKAEEFLFDRDDLAGAMVRIFSPEVSKMEKTFEIEGSKIEDDVSTITLRPLRDDVRAFMTHLTLRISVSELMIQGVEYESAEGDRVMIELKDLELDPKLEASLFDKKLPPGTKVQVHRVESGDR
jgi:outer membrane lipoprotein-sorting protein